MFIKLVRSRPEDTLRASAPNCISWPLPETHVYFQDSCPYLLLQCLQRLKFQSGQFQLDVLWFIMDGKGEYKLQSQESVLKTRKSTR